MGVYVCHSMEELIRYYDTSGLLTMIAQEYIHWDYYLRCMCLGREKVLVMPYDTHTRKYLPDGNYLPKALHERVVRDCLTLAESDPPSAIINASEWQKNKGGYLAQACLATAFSEQNEHIKAAQNFVAAAAEAQAKNDKIASAFWAQAGSEALASGDLPAAQQHLTAALVGQTLQRIPRSEALLNRARIYVAGGQLETAAKDLSQARSIMPNDSAAWLLSATLARRMNDLNGAQNFIKTAAALSPSDAHVALEAGNIAAAAGAYDIAREQWLQTIRIAPQSVQADTARKLVEQLAVIGSAGKLPKVVSMPQAITPKANAEQPETR